MPVMTMDSRDQPTAREILDAVLHSQDVLATALRRVEDDVTVLKTDVAELRTDVRKFGEDLYRLERRVIRIDDRLSVIEGL
ncbi:MAG TPA: hypothetical protein VEV38_07240 [Candidatus Eremiobacteraceae bacterium]|nr:hypothetical protein [Candidatus Eremiobacteraceae bacterium]